MYVECCAATLYVNPTPRVPAQLHRSTRDPSSIRKTTSRGLQMQFPFECLLTEPVLSPYSTSLVTTHVLFLLEEPRLPPRARVGVASLSASQDAGAATGSDVPR